MHKFLWPLKWYKVTREIKKFTLVTSQKDKGWLLKNVLGLTNFKWNLRRNWRALDLLPAVKLETASDKTCSDDASWRWGGVESCFHTQGIYFIPCCFGHEVTGRWVNLDLRDGLLSDAGVRRSELLGLGARRVPPAVDRQRDTGDHAGVIRGQERHCPAR